MPNLFRSRYWLLALPYSILEATRHPSHGGGSALADVADTAIIIVPLKA
jgi:hypothetical protein